MADVCALRCSNGKAEYALACAGNMRAGRLGGCPCPKGSHGPWAPSPDAAKAAAKKDGWRARKDGKLVCQHCFARRRS